jgi:hypothetical protein
MCTTGFLDSGEGRRNRHLRAVEWISDKTHMKAMNVDSQEPPVELYSI